MLSSVPVELRGLPFMPADPQDAAYIIGHLFTKFSAVESKLSDVQMSLARQDVVLENLSADVSGLKSDRDKDRATYATDRESDRRAIEWADSWRRGVTYLVGAVVVAALGAAATWFAGFWERRH